MYVIKKTGLAKFCLLASSFGVELSLQGFVPSKDAVRLKKKVLSFITMQYIGKYG